MRGIAGYGVYVPHWRLDLKSLATSRRRPGRRPAAGRGRTAPRARSRATSDRAASGGRRRRSRRCRACAADSIRRVPGVHVYAVTMAGSEWSSAIAVAAFVASYVGLGLGRVPPFRVDRTGIAIIGAAAMVVSGALPWPDAVAAVDAPTLVLLFGMMIVTAYLRLSGFFRLVMMWALRRARTPLGLLAAAVVSPLAVGPADRDRPRLVA